jgi:hypothetical protein
MGDAAFRERETGLLASCRESEGRNGIGCSPAGAWSDVSYSASGSWRMRVNDTPWAGNRRGLTIEAIADSSYGEQVFLLRAGQQGGGGSFAQPDVPLLEGQEFTVLALANGSMTLTSSTEPGVAEFINGLLVDSLPGVTPVQPATGRPGPPKGCTLSPGAAGPSYRFEMGAGSDAARGLGVFRGDASVCHDREPGAAGLTDCVTVDGAGSEIGIAAAGDPQFLATAVELPAGSSVGVVADWTNLAEAPLSLQIDLGNDGTVDDTVVAQNELGGTPADVGDDPAAVAFRFEVRSPAASGQGVQIRGSIPRECDLNLHAYDVMGRRIATIAEGRHTAGEFAFSWAGRSDWGSASLSGVYFLRLEARTVDGRDIFRRTRKALVVR